MILLINVMLTDEVLNLDTYRYQRGFLDHPYQPHKYDKVDIFKYSLASYSIIPFSRVLIYCKLDKMYAGREEELRSFIEKEFAHQKLGPNLELHFDRLEYQGDWQYVYQHKITDTPEDEPIWFCCNHDHIFMDYDLTVLKNGLDLLSQKEHEIYQREDPASIYFSHWPELLRKASHIHNEKPGPTDLYDKYVGFSLLNNNDSIQIINKALYKRWWFEEDYGSAFLPRSDYRLADKDGNLIGYDIRDGRRYMLSHYCFVPLREMCRHYDGYGHVQINSNECPALTIPPGFFENDIKIRYGYYDNLVGHVNICPSHRYYSIFDKRGTDYKWVVKEMVDGTIGGVVDEPIDDVPLFWKDRISNIDINPDITPGTDSHYGNYLFDCRDDAVEETALTRIKMDYSSDFEKTSMPRDQQWYENFKKLNRKSPFSYEWE